MSLRHALLAVAGLAVALPAQPSPTPLRAGATVSGRLAAGDTARFALTLRDSTFLLGSVTQPDQPLAVRFLAGGGRPRARFEGPGVGALRFAMVTADTGAGIVEVTAPSGRAATFSLTLLRQEPLAKEAARRADQLLARYDAPGVPGGEVRVWREGRVLYSKGFGMADLRHGIPYRTDTPTNIGSTSKQFTAFAVLLQAERGKLSLEDDIRRHLPELPDLGDTVRVRHLITHQSGLREFLNLLLMSDRQVGEDLVDRGELLTIVQRQPKLQNAPGAEFNYNNTAFGLAALIVERTSGKSFPDFLRDEVFVPLGMTRSMARADRVTIVPHAATGYVARATGYAEAIDLGGALGAGGIYTTVEDLQRWSENMLAATPRIGSRAIFDAMTTNGRLSDGKRSDYGMGVFIDEQRGLRRIQHGGADVAHRSMLALYPTIRGGVSVQSNDAGFASAVAFDIAAAFFADAMTAAAPAAGGGTAGGAYDAARMTDDRFDAFAGRYALDAAPAFVIRIFREGSARFLQATGQPRVGLVATSDSSFALTGVAAALRFRRDATGRVVGLTLQQGGEQPATRLPDAPVFAPTGRALAAFVGRYWSDELESAMTIEQRGDTLWLRQRRHPDARLTAVDRIDTFEGRTLTLAFERDRNGEVIGFYAANGRTRDVRFARVRP